jgi:uncharacterized protein (DUF58 family)
MTATRKLYILLLMATLPLALSQWWPALRPSGIVIDAIILMLLIVDYQLTPRPWLITATRKVTDRLSIGRQNPVKLTILNQGNTAIKCYVKDDYPSNIESDVSQFQLQLPAAGLSNISYNLLPRRRGAYKFGKISIRYLSFLGLIWREVKVPSAHCVKVYSDLKALHDLSVKLSHSSELGELHQRKRGQGTDFSSLKEYTVGDDSKSIDWKATARRDRPVIRTYEAEQEQRLLILIDAGRMMVSELEGLTRFDHALNAALCLALTGLSHNDQVGLGVFADRPLTYLPPRRSKGYLRNILEATFDLEPRMVEPDYAGVLSYFASAQKGRSLIVVLSDLTDPTGSQSLLAGLASLSPRHLPFCVTLKDRQVTEVANQISSNTHLSGQIAKHTMSLDDIFRRAVATDLLTQRELALSVLTRRGCMVLDCPPQELSSKLVDGYLHIKARAKL